MICDERLLYITNFFRQNLLTSRTRRRVLTSLQENSKREEDGEMKQLREKVGSMLRIRVAPDAEMAGYLSFFAGYPAE